MPGGVKNTTQGGKVVIYVRNHIFGLDWTELTKLTWKVEYWTGSSPTEAEAMEVVTIQTSAVTIYTLYDSSRSLDVSNFGCIIA